MIHPTVAARNGAPVKARSLGNMSTADAASAGYAVWARNISAAYEGPPVLHDVNLELPRGELIAIVGPNGAGKTTFFKLLIGIKQPLQGNLFIFGQTVDAQRQRSEIAYVPQEEHIDWDYPISVGDVVMGGRYGRIRSADGWRRFLPHRWAGQVHTDAVAAALQAVDMLAYKQRPIGALSGGQKKRVFLARALAQDAQLLLLDEPLVGVDQRSEALIFDVLNAARNEGRSVIMVTHDLPSAHRYADRAVLINGTVIAAGPPDEVLTDKHLARTYQAGLLGPGVDERRAIATRGH